MTLLDTQGGQMSKFYQDTPDFIHCAQVSWRNFLRCKYGGEWGGGHIVMMNVCPKYEFEWNFQFPKSGHPVDTPTKTYFLMTSTETITESSLVKTG